MSQLLGLASLFASLQCHGAGECSTTLLTSDILMHLNRATTARSGHMQTHTAQSASQSRILQICWVTKLLGLLGAPLYLYQHVSRDTVERFCQVQTNMQTQQDLEIAYAFTSGCTGLAQMLHNAAHLGHVGALAKTQSRVDLWAMYAKIERFMMRSGTASCAVVASNPDTALPKGCSRSFGNMLRGSSGISPE